MHEEQAELNQINIIRNETILSRYPMHRLAKRGDINIEIHRSNDNGNLIFRWEISHNNKHGQPGPLAYKLDTLIINRRIEEAGKPVPSIIKLGSLREINRELGSHESGENDAGIKKALFQNASAFINAFLLYRANDGSERKFEFGATRYDVVFTGKKLPGGQKADAVYIVLHDIYRDLLNASPTRPLDYDYLKELPPSAQRFYELLSFQIFAALKNNRPRAKYLYSEYCACAPQTRYFDFNHVKKQMYKVHALHRKSGYIERAEFEEVTDDKGNPDWLMFYTPGDKARFEFREFTKKKAPLFIDSEPKKPSKERRPKEAPGLPPEEEKLVSKLKELHIAEASARELVRDYRQSVELQLNALSHRDRSNIRDLASWLVRAIKENYALPEIVVKAEAKATKVKEETARKAYETARQRHQERHGEAFSVYLTSRIGEIKKSDPEAYRAFEEDTKEEQKKTFGVFTPESRAGKAIFEGIVCTYFRNHPKHPILGFWEWDSQLNPEPFKYDA